LDGVEVVTEDGVGMLGMKRGFVSRSVLIFVAGSGFRESDRGLLKRSRLYLQNATQPVTLVYIEIT
jgi:hypothetical protein